VVLAADATSALAASTLGASAAAWRVWLSMARQWSCDDAGTFIPAARAAAAASL
jgi:hypothetical protein